VASSGNSQFFQFAAQMEQQKQVFDIHIASEQDFGFAEEICLEMEESAKARGTGIAKRSPEYIRQKMSEGKAVIALTQSGEWAGFCYIETWGHGEYVANSGLIVKPTLRKSGLAKQIKQTVFKLSRTTYPDAKIFDKVTKLPVALILPVATTAFPAEAPNVQITLCNTHTTIGQTYSTCNSRCCLQCVTKYSLTTAGNSNS